MPATNNQNENKMKPRNTWTALTITALLTACGGGSTPAPSAEDGVVAPSPFTPEPIVVVDEPIVEPEPVDVPDSVTYDGQMLFQIEKVEVFDESPTAAFVRIANFTDNNLIYVDCRLAAYQNENPVMLIQTQQLYTPEGAELQLSSGQDSTTRMSFSAEGYTGHHVDKVEWRCWFEFEDVNGRTRNTGTWEGESVYG